MSVLRPHCGVAIPAKPVDEYRGYHVPLEGRKTVISDRPSPAKSDEGADGSRGRAPIGTVAVSPVMRLERNHGPVDGRQMHNSAAPSPSVSRPSGMSPVRPKPGMTTAPPPLRFKYQVAVDGRKTTKSSLPSLSKSP